MPFGDVGSFPLGDWRPFCTTLTERDLSRPRDRSSTRVADTAGSSQTYHQLLEAQNTLREKVTELKQFEQAAIVRELQMIELERELLRLRAQVKDQ